MNKPNALRMAADSVFLVIFNALFFILGGTKHAPSVWISYGIIHGAYLMALATPLLTYQGTSAAVFGFTVGAASSTYFVAELAVGTVFILAAPMNYQAALLVQLCLAGGYAFLLLRVLAANQQTAGAEEQPRYEIHYVKKAASQLQSVVEEVVGKDVRRAVERVYDAVNASPTKSHPGVSALELQILGAIADLRVEVAARNETGIRSQAVVLLRIVEERNRQLKLLNQSP